MVRIFRSARLPRRRSARLPRRLLLLVGFCWLLLPGEAAANLFFDRGTWLLGQNDLQGAITDLNRAIEIDPRAVDAYLNRGIAYERLRQWDKAIGDYSRVLELQPQDAYAYNNLGNAYGGKGEWERSLAYYERAAQLDPKLSISQVNAALVLYQVGREVEAAKRIRNLVRRYPYWAEVRAAWTVMLWQQGRHGEAESNWVAVLGLDKRYTDLEWVREVRRWPPRLVEELEKFLQLQ
ncbi:MAG: tetratricopeptide repeat protein [Pseudanabaenaceae cyanobacterium SKYGB_i_bin29]|nr:tetratricopeptide repeat protein [Pseudanabaenaceae cyanobacterium SKYG29]MDW8421518.1 tetratricopeptide repeat protein [Pseudanabaenaceae cyanobacterium SKYGB_i_bin29]